MVCVPSRGVFICLHAHRRDTGESIEILALPMDNAEAFIFDENLPKSPGVMFGVLWLQQKLRNEKRG